MTSQVETTEGVGVPGRRLGQLRSTDTTPNYAEVDGLKSEFRKRLEPLVSLGLLASGVRAILRENGFGQEVIRRHCGCPSCVERCPGCADL